MPRAALNVIASGLLMMPAVAIAAPGSPAADPPAAGEPFPTGRVIERVICAADTGRSYALYLPARYTPERLWPILVLMDPRGRALVPMELFREAAERLGYVVASSYDTRSDDPRPLNQAAMRAMLPDLRGRLALDPRRLYLAGFSGTARAAWGFAAAPGGAVAGVIGAGAGHPPDYQLIDRMPFVFFGTAGTGDFNYDEMRALDEALDRSGTPHRFDYFDGAHRWPDASLCGRALDWMELQAMRDGLRQPDGTLIDSLYGAMMSQGRRLREGGSDHDAWLLFRAITDDFSGLRDVDESRAEEDVLGRLDAVRAALSRHAEIAREHAAYQTMLMSFLAGLHRPGSPPPLSRSLRTLRIDELKRRMEANGDPIGAAAAKRWLEHAYVLTSFYVPRDRLDEAEPEFALAALQVAAAIKPKNARICLGEARAYAQLGKNRRALRSLECAAEGGAIDPGQLAGDPYLEPLRGEAAYRRLIERRDGP